MYVSGLSSATRWSSIRVSPRRPLNFDLNDASQRRASSSTTIQPTLWRSRSCRGPGFPSPATSRSSVEAARLDGRAARLLLGLGALAGVRSLGRRGLGDGFLALGGLGRLGGLGGFAASASSSSVNPRGTETVAMTVSCGSSRSVTLSIAGTSARRSTSPTSRCVTSTSMCSGHVRRQRLDVELARDEREHAARLHAGRLADELHDDRRMDRLVEPHLTQIDVRDRAANRILLVLGEDRRMHRLLALDDDVEDRVKPGRACHHGTKLPLGDGDRARVTLPVQDAGDEPLRAEAPGAARADLLALAHFELQSVSRHGGGL